MGQDHRFMRTVRVRNIRETGTLARLLVAISSSGASIGSIEMLTETAQSVVRDITVYADRLDPSGRFVPVLFFLEAG